MRFPRLLVVMALALLAGCGQDAVPESTETPDATPTASVAPSSSIVVSPEVPDLVLTATGLGPLVFGTPRAEVLAELESRFGAPDDSGPGCELRGPDVTFVAFKELFVTFDGDTFVDYNYRGADPALNLTTEEGIGVGSTVAELQATYEDRLTIPGLPEEVFGGEDFAIAFPGTEEFLLGGITSTAEDGTVTGFFTSVCE